MIVHNDFPLSDILWYKIGGKARVLLETSTKEDVTEALDYIDKHNIKKTFVVGLGSNLIFTDDYFDGAVILIDGKEAKNNPPQMRDGVFVEAFAGVVLDDVIQFAFAHSLSGLEWAGGLPGTLGAGVRGNVGAFGGEIKDVVADAEVLELTGGSFSIEKLTNQELQFSYRESVIKQNRNRIVLSATLQLRSADETSLMQAKKIYEQNITYRKTNHPLEYPNCGSVFKNIKSQDQVEKILSVWPDSQELISGKWHGKVSMGYVIKRLGLSGRKVGNAQISEKHANFIVNLGYAKAGDVKTLIKEIQEKTQEQFGFTPEVEVEIVD